VNKYTLLSPHLFLKKNPATSCFAKVKPATDITIAVCPRTCRIYLPSATKTAIRIPVLKDLRIGWFDGLFSNSGCPRPTPAINH
jgi:hypothetical protein